MGVTLPKPAIAHEDFPEPDLPLLHDRVYSVRSYQKSPTELLIRGQVRDQKPPGLYFEDDPEPLTVHHMVLDIVVSFPDMVIIDANLVMQTRPHTTCTKIEPHYKSLIGVSIARGFSRQIRELFGGPRGCTHTTALLQAMAPVAIQSVWSMYSSSDEVPVPPPLPSKPTDEDIRAHFAFNLNSCHVWDEDGEIIEGVKNGEEVEPPLWVIERADKLGRSVDEWTTRRGAAKESG